MRFIRDHKIASILILLILIFSMLMVFSYKNFGKHKPVSSFITGAFMRISEPIADAGYNLRNTAISIFRFKTISEENAKLKKKVTKLESEVIKGQMQANQLQELNELSEALKYEPIQRANSYVAADIVAMDNSNIFNGFTINRGIESKIGINSIVVNGDGLVGRIAEAEDGYSKVVSIIDEMNNVSFMVQRDMNIIGIVKGNGKGQLDGFTIDGKAEIIQGDVVLTSGIGNYPPGIKIGKIAAVKYSSDTQLKTIEVKPAVNFKRIHKVLVAQ